MVMNEKKDTQYWRRIACCLVFLWVVLLSVSMRFYLTRYTEQDILTPISGITLYGITISGCLLLVIFPLQFYIYTFLCCLLGILDIVEGGSALGVLMYGLGLFFAWKKEFFATRWKVKLSLASIPLIVALFSQLRYGAKMFLSSFIDISGLFAITTIVVFLVRHELENLRKNKTEGADMPQLQPTPELLPAKILMLSRDQFKRHDVAVAQGILAGKKYAAIAGEHDIAVITVKRRAKKLFTYANVPDALTFIAQYEGYTVELGTEADSVSLAVDIRIISPEADSQA